jgi:hypothetical protein
VFLPFETNFKKEVVATFFLALSAKLNNPELREITINHLKEEIYNV